MKQRLFKYCSRSTIIFCEALAAIVCLSLIIVSVLIWRLTSGPVDVSFAKDHIEQALSAQDSGYSLSLEGASVYWPELKGPILLQFKEISIYKDQQSILDISKVALELSRGHILIGKIKPRGIVLSEPALWLIRTADNDFRISLNDQESSESEVDNNYIMELIQGLSEKKDQDTILDGLRSIIVEDARMIIEDHMVGITWFLPSIDLAFSKVAEGLIASVDVELPGGKNNASQVQAIMSFGHQSEKFTLDLQLQDFDPHILSKKFQELDWLNDHELYLDGTINAVLDTELTVKSAELALMSHNGIISLPEYYQAPLLYEQIALNGHYDEEGNVEVKELEISVGETTLNLSASTNINKDNYTIPLKLEIPALKQSAIKPLWPDTITDISAYEWIVEKLSVGALRNIILTLDILVNTDSHNKTSVKVENILADFDLENMSVDYRPPLMPVSQAYGSGHFENDILSISLKTAKISDLDVTKSDIKITEILSDKVGNANITVDLNGSLQTVFTYIKEEPIDMGDSLDLDFDNIAGNAELNVVVNLPTSKDVSFEDVDVEVKGELNNTRLPKIVRGLDITGGPLILNVSDGYAELKGQAYFDGRLADMKWFQYLRSDGKPFSTKVNAKLGIDRELREHFGVFVHDYLEGTVPAEIIYTEYNDNTAQIKVDADLQNATFMIKPFKYEKKPGEKGTASCIVNLKDDTVQNVSDLNVQTSRANVEKAILEFDYLNDEGRLSRGIIPDFRLDETDLKIEFEIDEKELVKMSVEGPFLDARPFLENRNTKGAYTNPAIKVSVDVGRMRTHPARLVEKAKIYLDMSNKGDVNQLEMDAIAGKGDVYFRLKPNAKGVQTLRFEADDAGAALRAFNVYQNIEGGKLIVHGKANNPEKQHILTGSLEVIDFRVVNAPVLARLISAIGPTGIPALLSGEGLSFTKLEAKFQWHLNSNGFLYVAKDGRTSGNSLGITFEGRIDKGKDEIDMSGQIIPISMVNSLVSNIPLIGDILAGGDDGAVFAATYTVKGPTKEPTVTVNPLAALTPGIIRRILFE